MQHSNDGPRYIPRCLSQGSGDDNLSFNSRAERFQMTGTDSPSDDSCDISEVVTVPKSSLPPLASEVFRQELYIRGYLKRPRPSNVIPRKSRLVLMFSNRNVFPKVLGRRQGRKVAESLKAEQDAAESSGLDTPDKHPSPTVSCAPLRTPHADTLDSPWGNTNTTPSESFDLHEFSYLTAFTTPPTSPSMIVDAETLEKGVDLGDNKHAV